LLKWQGLRVYAMAGQWVLGFERPKRLEDREFAGPTTPGDELQAELDELGLGLRFDHYLGVKHVVLIRAPKALRHRELREALTALEKFDHVAPNTLAMFDDGV
jgi:hypothetical protein